MVTREQAVRDAALELQIKITEAVAEGYRVVWPGSAADLDKIAISETGAVKQQEFAPRKPVPTFNRPVVE